MNVDRTTLFDTAAHAAATALTAAADACADPVRCQNARAVYGLITESASGQPAAARRRAATVVAVVADAADTDSDCAALALALERWLLH
ncbi:hypothetical protein, partial [Mycolicibacterium sp.]|uniref:hypothetical protein n=1 Tax=Mycolicibacterium sp. TaxID=2320850 RepID=UPI00355D850A